MPQMWNRSEILGEIVETRGNPMSHSYPSNISSWKFGFDRTSLPEWRMLPVDCYKYFQQWSERPDPEQDSILEQKRPTRQWSESPADPDTPKATRTVLEALETLSNVTGAARTSIRVFPSKGENFRHRCGKNRKKAQSQPANGGACLRSTNPE